MNTATDTADRYILLSRLHRGTCSEIYRARVGGACGFEKLVAVKRLLPEGRDEALTRRRFVHQSTVASRLTHHGLVGVYDFYQRESGLYQVMELVDGVSLEQLLAHRRRLGTPLPVPTLLAMLTQLSEVLAYLHQAFDTRTKSPLNLVHRDLSPAHILIDRAGALKVIGFGKAWLRGEEDLLENGLESPYAAPELSASSEPSPQADLYAVGVILWELLTLETPPPHASAARAPWQQQLASPAWRQLLPGPYRGVAQLAAQLTAIQPLERIQGHWRLPQEAKTLYHAEPQAHTGRAGLRLEVEAALTFARQAPTDSSFVLEHFPDELTDGLASVAAYPTVPPMVFDPLPAGARALSTPGTFPFRTPPAPQADPMSPEPLEPGSRGLRPANRPSTASSLPGDALDTSSPGGTPLSTPPPSHFAPQPAAPARSSQEQPLPPNGSATSPSSLEAEQAPGSDQGEGTAPASADAPAAKAETPPAERAAPETPSPQEKERGVSASGAEGGPVTGRGSGDAADAGAGASRQEDLDFKDESDFGEDSYAPTDIGRREPPRPAPQEWKPAPASRRPARLRDRDTTSVLLEFVDALGLVKPQSTPVSRPAGVRSLSTESPDTAPVAESLFDRPFRPSLTPESLFDKPFRPSTTSPEPDLESLFDQPLRSVSSGPSPSPAGEVPAPRSETSSSSASSSLASESFFDQPFQADETLRSPPRSLVTPPAAGSAPLPSLEEEADATLRSGSAFDLVPKAPALERSEETAVPALPDDDESAELSLELSLDEGTPAAALLSGGGEKRGASGTVSLEGEAPSAEPSVPQPPEAAPFLASSQPDLQVELEEDDAPELDIEASLDEAELPAARLAPLRITAEELDNEATFDAALPMDEGSEEELEALFAPYQPKALPPLDWELSQDAEESGGSAGTEGLAGALTDLDDGEGPGLPIEGLDFPTEEVALPDVPLPPPPGMSDAVKAILEAPTRLLPPAAERVEAAPMPDPAILEAPTRLRPSEAVPKETSALLEVPTRLLPDPPTPVQPSDWSTGEEDAPTQVRPAPAGRSVASAQELPPPPRPAAPASAEAPAVLEASTEPLPVPLLAGDWPAGDYEAPTVPLARYPLPPVPGPTSLFAPPTEAPSSAPGLEVKPAVLPPPAVPDWRAGTGIALFFLSPSPGLLCAVPDAGLTLGRSHACDLVLADLEVAPRHAIILWEGGRWWLRAQRGESLWIDGDREQEVVMKAGMTVTMGRCRFVVLVDRREEAEVILDYVSLEAELVQRFPTALRDERFRHNVGIQLEDALLQAPSAQLWKETLARLREAPDPRPLRRLLDALLRLSPEAPQAQRARACLLSLERWY